MGPRWLKVEPARLALLGGLFFSMVVMVFYFIRQITGTLMEPADVLLGVAKTFLVSYAGTGFFVWYLLRVADHELSHRTPKPEIAKERKSGLDHKTAEEHNDHQDWDEAGAPVEQPEEHS